MKIDLEKLGEACWVDWQEGVRLKIRPLPVSKTTEIQKKATTKKVEFIDGRRHFKEIIDNEKFNELLEDWIIEDWDGLYDQHGEKIPCTPEMKRAILDHMHELRLFSVMTARELEELREEQQKEEEKNS